MTNTGVPSGGRDDQTSTTLLFRIQALEPEAWRRFVHLYGPLIFQWCRQAGFQDADAADIGQEVFRAVARTITSFRHDRSTGTFQGWLRTIVRNKIRDHVRRQRPGDDGAGGSDAQAALLALPADSDSSSDSDVSDKKDQLALYRRAMDLLLADYKDDTRQAFLRVVVDNHDPADVARDLGMSKNAIYLAKSRILKRLREEFADLLDL